MDELKCTVLHCNTTLGSFGEAASGMCEKCMSLLDRRHHFAVVCWQCGTPTLIDAKPVEAGEVIIKDKYIMSSSCPKCKEGSDGLRMMTIRPEDKSNVMLGKDETLNLGDRGLEAGPKKATIHRDIKPTVDIDNGATVLGEITISPEIITEQGIENANHFLDNLTLDENYDPKSNPS